MIDFSPSSTAFTRRVSPTSNGATNVAIINAAAQEVKLHGGVVELDGGDYPLATIQGTTPGAAAGAVCLFIPSNVVLRGQGKHATTLKATAGGAFGTGTIIHPEGVDTATGAFGAASSWGVEDLGVEATDQAASSGNLFGVIHTQGVRVRRVRIGSSYYHGLEHQDSRDVRFEDCDFDGQHDWTSGNHVQFDKGDAGHQSPTATKLSEDVTFENCLFAQRTGGSVRDIELAHNTTPELRRITFRGCTMHGRNAANTYIADVGTGISLTSGFVEELLFEDCTFHTYHADAYAFYLIQNSGALFDGIRFRNNKFNLRGHGIWAGGGSDSATSLQTDYRRELEFTGNRVDVIKADFPNGASNWYGFVFNHWLNAVVRDNRFRGQGSFPGGYTTANFWALRAGQCWDLDMSENRMDWTGNNPPSSSRVGFNAVNTALDQNAIPTRRVVCRNNRLTSGTAVWSHGIILDRHTTLPAGSIYKADGNWSNIATSAPNQVQLIGAAPV